MTTVYLNRFISGPQGTFSTLSFKGRPLCVACENPWLGNRPRISCIPKGMYECVPHNTAKYPNVWRVENVPGRTAILFHWGNTIQDTEGCILVGRSFDYEVPGVLDSMSTIKMLRRVLPPKFDLVISGPEGIDYNI